MEERLNGIEEVVGSSPIGSTRVGNSMYLTGARRSGNAGFGAHRGQSRVKTPMLSRLPRRHLLLVSGGLGLATLAVACGAEAAAPAKSIAAASAAAPPAVPTDAPAATTEPAPTAEASASATAAETTPASEAPAAVGNAAETSEETPTAAAAPPTAAPVAESAPAAPTFPHPTPYNPDDRDSIKERYSEDAARFEAVLAAGVPVLWVTDAIW